MQDHFNYLWTSAALVATHDIAQSLEILAVSFVLDWIMLEFIVFAAFMLIRGRIADDLDSQKRAGAMFAGLLAGTAIMLVARNVLIGPGIRICGVFWKLAHS